MAEQGVVELAKAQVIAYNDKNWGAATEALGSGVVYDEVGTNRKLTGPGQVIDAWKGWATALPDSKATFDAAHVAGNTVILELTWRGTHRGPLQTPAGQIPATGKPIEIRACQRETNLSASTTAQLSARPITTSPVVGSSNIDEDSSSSTSR